MADSVVHAADSALNEAPEAFDGVGVDIAHDIDLGRMVNAAVLITEKLAFSRFQLWDGVVGHVLVGVNRALRQDVLFRHVKQLILAPNARLGLGYHFAFALHDPGHPGLVRHASTASFADVEASAEVCFIHLGWPFEFDVFRKQRTNLFKYTPRGFVSDAGFALDLLGRDSATGSNPSGTWHRTTSAGW